MSKILFKGLKATEVFTPGAFPAHTYVAREGAVLEQALQDAIDTPGQIVSLVGPSKSGKTVLVEKVVGYDHLITVTGASIASPDDIWSNVCMQLDLPESHTDSSSDVTKVSAESEMKGALGISVLAKITGGFKAGAGKDRQTGTSQTWKRRGLEEVVKRLANTETVVLVDDFHYMPREVQAEAAKSLKEAVRRGVKVVTAAVLHRGDDLVRANPELRGRVKSIDLVYWNSPELMEIASRGFEQLNVEMAEESVAALVQEAAGSPQLMQLLCLRACFVLDFRNCANTRTKVLIESKQLQTIFQQASANTDFRSLVDVLDSGPKTRGTERKLYKFSDGATGDVYRVVLKAVAADPPRLSFSYEDLGTRTVKVCIDESPMGSSIVSTCHHMAKLALEKFPNERAIDGDEQKQILDIPDPYLGFYLRWSGRLSEDE